MKRDCYPAEALGELLEAHPSDPRLSHVRSCVRCRNLMESLREFRAPTGEMAAHEVAEAETRLEAALERELPVTPAHHSPWTRAWQALFGGAWWRPALAAAAVVLLVVAAAQFTQGPELAPSGTIRGEAAAALAVEAEQPAEGGLRLSWEAAEGASAYRVIFSDLGLEEIHVREMDRARSLTLTAPELRALAPAGTRVLWRVVAVREGAELANSRSGAVTIPQPGR